MPLTPDHILNERREAIKNSVMRSVHFRLKDGWPVNYDSAHIELIQESEDSFFDLMEILDHNTHLKRLTIWIAGGKELRMTKHKKRLFWFGSDCVSKLRVKTILRTAKPRN